MEPLIRVKKYTFKLMQPLFQEGEQVQMVIPCGRMNFEPGTIQRAKDRDYLIITDQRLISLKGSWFENQQGIMSYPRKMIIGVDVDTYLLGCTVTIHIQPMQGGDAKQVDFPNCGKPESEAVQKMFSEQQAGRRCTGCGRTLQEDFTFCPFCKTSIKRLCANCGKPLEEGWVNCPYCGR